MSFSSQVHRRRDVNKVRPNELYLSSEDLDFSWEHEELMQVKKLWKDGISIPDIAIEIDREQDEIAILIMDLRRNNKIELRKGGVFGG